MIIRLIKEVKKPTGKAYFKPGTEIPVNKEWGEQLLKEGKAVKVERAKVSDLLGKKKIDPAPVINWAKDEEE